ncbi:MAG: aminotransferase class IV [bacterium]
MHYLALNGRIVPEEQAFISPLDRGFLYGDGLFETLKARRDRIFFLDRHLARLERDCLFLGISFPAGLDYRGLILELLERNRIRGDGAVKIHVTRGRHEGLLYLHESPSPTVTILASPYQAAAPDKWEQGLSVSVETDIRQNPSSGLCQAKTLNYLFYLLLRTRARAKGFEDAVILNHDGDVCECTASNLFAFRGGRLQTPEVTCGLLPGVLRETLIECMAEAGEPVVEARLSTEELLESAEVFVTNSLAEVLPVGRIDGKVLPVRDKTKAVRARYQAWIKDKR